MARYTSVGAAASSSAQARDSLELASLASSSGSPRSSIASSPSGAPSSRKLSLDSGSPPHGNGRPLTSDRRSFSVSSAFDFAPNLFPLSTSAAGYTAIGAPANANPEAGGGLEKHKTLTFLNGMSLIIGLIIGSGIFSSPAQVNKNAGSPGASLVVWTIAGILAWTGASSYAELGGALPLSGGPTVYLSKIYGEWAGFLFTWVAVTVLKPGSAAIIAIIFGEYIVRAVVGPDAMEVSTWLDKSVAFGGLALVTFINCVSTKMATRTTDILLFLKFVALVGVAVVGMVVAITGFSFKGQPSNDWKSIGWFDGTSHDLSEWAVALYAGLWAYDGWDNTNYVTGEFINPRRDLPRTIHTSLAMVIVSYLLANVSYLLVLPIETINSSNTVAVTFGKQVFGPIGSFAFALVVSFSCYGSLAATTFTSSRLVYAASREGLLPSWFQRLGWSKETAIRLPMRTSQMSKAARLFADDAGFFYTPIYATLLNGCITAGYVVVGDFSTLTTFYGVAGYTFYFFTVLGLIVLRVREPDLERPYRCWISTPIIFCAVSIFLLSRAVFAQPLQTMIVVAFIVAGVPLYFLRIYSSGRRGRRQAIDWKFWKRWGRP
ncbi:b(0,+)-type amino acid transporter 1 [Sphaceloma murrayae]|uniref:B(0,+)-type amino acid transporter 1 n=1 Tax=Sphaceloma murrayae TaxID=2082308 RepID=A0A2K1QHL6_9PEZI|nr:b(0,+)-type amino acid transporter 1 [Sphaceloma murrayae]